MAWLDPPTILSGSSLEVRKWLALVLVWMEKEGLEMCWSTRRPAQTEEEEKEGHLGNTVMGLFAEPDEGYLG